MKGFLLITFFLFLSSTPILGQRLGGDYWRKSNVSSPLWGFVDLVGTRKLRHQTKNLQNTHEIVFFFPLPSHKHTQHAHPMNHVGFGGHMFSGALEGHLSDCGNDHGRGPGDGVLSVQPEMGHKRNGPTLWNGWPTRKTLVHQQMHRDWLYRAWQGGLRVVHADVGNSRWSATQFQEINRLFVGKNPLPSDDASVIPLGMAVLRNFVANNSAWSEIATSSSHASSIISRGKLAIVPGIEVDEPDTILGVKHWNGTLELAQQKIRSALDFLYTNGVRHFFGVHILDTSFGGSAVNNALFDLNNYWVNGAFMNLTNGFANGYRYRQDLDSNLGRMHCPIDSTFSPSPKKATGLSE